MNAACRRPRVLQVITHFALGGAEKIALALVHGLGSGIDFAVFAVRDEEPDDVGRAMLRQLAAAGVPFRCGSRLAPRSGGLLLGALALAREVRRFRPDLLHVHTEIPEACTALAGWLDGLTGRIPVARTIHNSVLWPAHPWLGCWSDRRLAHAEVACVSASALRAFLDLRRRSGAAPVREPALIPNGVTVESPARREPSRNPAVRRLLFAGRFELQKGTDILCAAVSRVRLPAGIRGELVLFGRGRDEPRLRALASQPPPGWTIAIFPPSASLGEIYGEFDWVAMPSRFEGLPLVALEAVLAGVPVVATDAPGLDEVLPPDYPWRAPAGDPEAFALCLGRALAHPPGRNDDLVAAQHFARTRFSPEAMLAGYRRLYDRVVLAHP